MGGKLTIEYDIEVNGRIIAYIPELPGVIVNSKTKKGATKKALILAYRVLLDRWEHNESVPDLFYNQCKSFVKEKAVSV